jgi:hypothetical protein
MNDDDYRSRFGRTDYLLQASARGGVLLLGNPDLVEVQAVGHSSDVS